MKADKETYLFVGLSAAETEEAFAHCAARYGLSPEQLLRNFIRDLITDETDAETLERKRAASDYTEHYEEVYETTPSFLSYVATNYGFENISDILPLSCNDVPTPDDVKKYFNLFNIYTDYLGECAYRETGVDKRRKKYPAMITPSDDMRDVFSDLNAIRDYLVNAEKTLYPFKIGGKAND